MKYLVRFFISVKYIMKAVVEAVLTSRKFENSRYLIHRGIKMKAFKSPVLVEGKEERKISFCEQRSSAADVWTGVTSTLIVHFNQL